MSGPFSPDALRPSAEFLSSVERKIAERRGQMPAAAKQPVPAPQAVPEISQDGYELAAAVLAWFEPETLRPLANAPRTGSVTELVMQCVKSADESGQERCALSSGRRIEALKALREKGLVSAALAANARSQDPVQLTLDGYLTGAAKKIEDQTLADLASTHQVCDWLRSAGFPSIPSVQEIVQRVEWLSLLNPFEHVASDSRFRGRKKELAELREYAGVLPPGTTLQTVKRVFESVFDLQQQPPLLIVGVGGVGKSTLVSRFILEHARALEIHRFPFAYLDFDRPEINPSEPLTLLIEAVRQLGIEYPQARMQCDSLGRAWAENAAGSHRTIEAQSKSLRTTTSANQALSIAIADFASMVTTLGAKGSPVLFVLDTFEEVQWRSAGSVDAIWNLLEGLQEKMPRLRVVLAGRADVEGKKTRTLALTGLDSESAVAFLRSHGINDERVAKRVAQQIGGSPLSLQLAAELYRQEGADEGGELAISSRTSLFFKMDSALLQRQLYTRVLNHVHDPNVRKLAHPGLVLRRITPELILEVLAEPCGIKIRNLEDAQRLFHALKREVALVSEAPDGSVRHRRDLRMVMVELLRADSAVRVDDIHERAIVYYKDHSTTAVERAEEIYHRLSLDQDPYAIADRWMKGVEPHLTSAMEEFSGRRRAWLASRLGLDVDAATRQLASLEDWESIAVRDAEQLLSHGQGKSALEVIRARKDRPAVGPLVGLEARALVQLGLPEEALDLAEQGFAAAVDAANREFSLALALQAADIVLASGSRNVRATIETIDRLSMMREGKVAPAEEVAILARCIALAGADERLQKRKAGDLRKLRKSFDACPDDDLIARITLGYWAAAVFEREDVARVAHVVSLCGLPRGSDAELRALGSHFTFLDVTLSRRAGVKEGMLANKLAIPMQSSLTVTWGDYLLRAPEEVLRKQIPELLIEYGENDEIGGVVFGVGRVMQAALGIQTIRNPENVRPNGRPRGTPPPAKRADKKLVSRVSNAIQNSFTPDSFAEFVRFRLDRNVAAFSLTTDPAKLSFDVTSAADTQGWLRDLVLQLANAKPDNSEIDSIARELGVRSQPQELEAIVARRTSNLDARAFSAFLGDAVPRVAVVRVGDGIRANGFLVGPDLLMTADYVLTDVYEGKVSSDDVTVSFDAGTGDPSNLSSFPLEKDWLVARRQIDQIADGFTGLGYALLRVSQSPGAQPIGGSRAEGSARLRQWFELAGEERIARPDDPITVIGWDVLAMESPMISVGRVHSAGSDGQIRYTSETERGFGGSPCFSHDFRLLGMHIGQTVIDRGTRVSVAISIAAIRADLGQRHLLEAASVAFY
jgi:hypothetical protein